MRKNKYKKRAIQLLALSVILTILVISYAVYKDKISQKAQTNPEAKEASAINQPKAKSKQEEQVQVKDSALIAVPYTLQGPLDNLDIHEESCEEAAALMYHYFLEGQTTFSGSTVIPPQKANDEMLKMKAWQVANYGSEPDLFV